MGKPASYQDETKSVQTQDQARPRPPLSAITANQLQAVTLRSTNAQGSQKTPTGCVYRLGVDVTCILCLLVCAFMEATGSFLKQSADQKHAPCVY
jgi:hypothetical protein